MPNSQRAFAFRSACIVFALGCGALHLTGAWWLAGEGISLRPRWVMAGWLGLHWAILFSATVVASSPLTVPRLGVGIAVAAWCGVAITLVTEQPITRYLLSYAAFALIAVAAQWSLALPLWRVADIPRHPPYRLTTRGLLTLTTLLAVLLVAIRQHPNLTAEWLLATTTWIALTIVLTLARLVVIDRRPVPLMLFFVVAMLAAPALLAGMQREALGRAVTEMGDATSLLWRIYLQTLIIFATAGILTMVLHLFGATDARRLSAASNAAR